MFTKVYTPIENNIPPLLSCFLNYLISGKNKRVSTVEAYKSDLTSFFKFVKQHKQGKNTEKKDSVILYDIDEAFIKSIKLSDIYAYINYITIVRNNGPHARARKTASIKSFFNFLHLNVKVIEDNIASELEAPKFEKPVPVHLTLNESIELLKSVDGLYSERDYAIITLFLNCGLKLSELTNLNLKDIYDNKLSVKSKGGKQRTVYLNKACIDALSRYLNVRPADCQSEALFISERKNRISNRTVQYLVKKYIDKANLGGNEYSVDKLRNTAAMLMCKYGNVDINTLQQILGNESISAAQIYAHAEEENMRKALDSNPLSDITK